MVRAVRAEFISFAIFPIRGIFTTTISRPSLARFVCMNITKPYINATNAIKEIKPFRRRNPLIAITARVDAGSSISSSSKVEVSVGTTYTSIRIPINIMTHMMTAGYTSAPRTLRRSSCSFFICVARIVSDSSSFPDISPAEIIAQKSLENTRGCLPTLSLNGSPFLMRSTKSCITVLKACDFVCRSSVSSARVMARPAFTMTLKLRANMSFSVSEIRPNMLNAFAEAGRRMCSPFATASPFSVAAMSM